MNIFKNTIGALMIGMLLLSSIPVLAQEDASTTVNINASSTFRANLKQEREALKEKLQQEREDMGKNAQEERKAFQAQVKDEVRLHIEDRVKAHANKMFDRLNATVDRFNKLIERIQSRIDKLSAAGKDTTEAQAKVDDAKNQMANIETDIANLPTEIDNALSQDQLVGAFKNTEELVKVIRDEFKAVHTTLVDAVNILKGLGGIKADANASTTVQD